MARVYPLFSSSKGNATFIGNNQSGVLVDAGVSCKRLIQGLEVCGLSADAVRAVFITHEHSDHISGLCVFLKNFKVPVYAKPTTIEYIIKNTRLPADADLRSCDEGMCAAGMQAESFATPHDTPQSCGYNFYTSDNKKLSVCTDLGIVTDEVERAITGSDLVLLESNYDEQMLKDGSYPYYLKRRISSDTGHLSNTNSAKMSRKLIAGGTTRIILGHLSQENNTPSVAEKSALRELTEFKRGRDYILEVAPVATTGKVVVL